MMVLLDLLDHLVHLAHQERSQPALHTDKLVATKDQLLEPETMVYQQIW